MSSPIPRTNSGSNTNKLNQEILYLVYKFIAQSGRFKNTRKCLKDELNSSGSLGQVYAWDGQPRDTSIEDIEKCFTSISDDHLKQILESVLGSRVEGQANNGSLLIPIDQLFSKSSSAFNYQKLLSKLKSCYTLLREVKDKRLQFQVRRDVLLSSIHVESFDDEDIPSTLRHYGQSNEIQHLTSQIESLKYDEEYEATACAEVLRELGRHGALKLPPSLNKTRNNVSSWLNTRSLGLSSFNHSLGSGLSKSIGPSSNKTSVNILTNYNVLWTISGHLLNPAYCAVFDRTGEFVISGADDFLVKVWNIRKGLLVHTLKGHQGYIALIEVSLDNSVIASACTLGIIRLWSLKTGLCLKSLDHGGSINWIKFDELTMALASAGDDGKCIVWDLTKILRNTLSTLDFDSNACTMLNLLTGEYQPGKQKTTSDVTSDTCSPESNMDVTTVASTSESEYWSNADAAPIPVTSPKEHKFNGYFQWSNENKGGNASGKLVLSHLNDGSHISGPDEVIKIHCLDISPLGDVLITGCEDGIARVWRFGDVDENERKTRSAQSSAEVSLHMLKGLVPNDEYRKLEFIASHLLQRLEGHVSGITDIKFSKLGDRLVTASLNDGTVRIWAFNRTYTKNEHIILVLKDDDSPDVPSNTMEPSLFSSRRTTKKQLKTEAFNVAWTCDDTRILTLQSVVTSSFVSLASSKESMQPTRLKIWDSFTGDLLRTVPLVGQVACKLLCPHPLQPSIALTSGLDGMVNIWNIEHEKLIISHRICDLDSVTPSHLVDANFSSDGQYIAVTDMLGRLTLLGLEQPSDKREFYYDQYFSADYSDIMVNPDGNVFDVGTQLPIHMAPRGLLCRMDGYAYDQQPPTLLGPNSISYDEVKQQINEKISSKDHVRKLMDQTFNFFQRNRMRNRQSRILSWKSVIPSFNDANQGQSNRKGQSKDKVTESTRPAKRVIEYLSDSDSDSQSDHSTRQNRYLRRSHRNRDTHRGNSRNESDLFRNLQQQSDREKRAALRAAKRESLRQRYSVVDSDDMSGPEDNQDVYGSDDMVSSTDSETLEAIANNGLRRSARNKSIKTKKSQKRRQIRIAEDDDNLDHVPRVSRRSQREITSESVPRRQKHSQSIRSPECGWGILNKGKKTIALDAEVDRKWLQEDRTFDSQYVPQIGDQVIYFPQGHIEVLHQYAESTPPPWHSFPRRWPLVECIVKDLVYEFPSRAEHRRCQSVLAIVTLALVGIPIKHQLTATGEYHVDFVPQRHTRHSATSEPSTFQVTLRNCNLPDYLIPSYLFYRCLRTPWHEGIKVAVVLSEFIARTSQSPTTTGEIVTYEREDKRYTARVIGLSNLSDNFPHSPWEALQIQFDDPNAESYHSIPIERIAPWEAIPVIDASKTYERSAIKFPRNTIPTDESSRILQSFENLLEIEADFCEPFRYEVDSSIFPEYYCTIPVPMYLDLIQRRLEKDYYRQIEALRFDINQILINCITFNSEGTEIVANARRLVEKLHNIVNGGSESMDQGDQAISIKSGTSIDDSNVVTKSSLLVKEKEESLSLRIPRRNVSTRSSTVVDDQEEELVFDMNIRDTGVRKSSRISESSGKSKQTRNDISNQTTNGHRLKVSSPTQETNEFILRISNRRAQVEQRGDTLRRSSRIATDNLHNLDSSDSIDSKSLSGNPKSQAYNIRSRTISKDLSDSSSEENSDDHDTRQTRSGRQIGQTANSQDTDSSTKYKIRPTEKRNARKVTSRVSYNEDDDSSSQEKDSDDEDTTENVSKVRMSLRPPSKRRSMEQMESDSDDNNNDSNGRRSKRQRRSISYKDYGSSVDEDDEGVDDVAPMRRSSRNSDSKTNHPAALEDPHPRRSSRHSLQSDIVTKPSDSVSYNNLTESQSSQTSSKRLDPELKKRVSRLLNIVTEADSNGFFQYPITDDIVPGYSSIIHVPMDVSTIRDNFAKRKYDSLQEVINDLELMFDNCLLFNDSKATVAKEAKRIRKIMMNALPSIINY